MRASEFLTEANLINTDAVRNNYLRVVADSLRDHADLQAWFQRAGLRYIQQLPVDGETIKPLTPVTLNDPRTHTENPWLRAALDRGDEVGFFSPSAAFHERVRSMVDWLLAQRENGARLNLDRMSFAQALEHAERWHREMAERKPNLPTAAEDVSGLKEVMKYQDGYRWVQIKSAEALRREGDIMQHCVGEGGYTSAVRSGRTKIYSLRDPRNEPHVTIEVTKKEVEQIKGKQNDAPVEKYRPYVKTFLQALKLPVAGGKMDLRRCGLAQRGEGEIDTLKTSQAVLPLANGMRAEIKTIEDEVSLKVLQGNSTVAACGVSESGQPYHLFLDRVFHLPLAVTQSIVEALNAADAPVWWYHGGGYETAGILPFEGNWRAVDPSDSVATLSDGTTMIETSTRSGRWYHFVQGNSLLRFCLAQRADDDDDPRWEPGGWSILLQSGQTDQETEADRKPWVRKHLAEALNAIPEDRRPQLDASHYGIFRSPDGRYGRPAETGQPVADWPNGVRMALARDEQSQYHGHTREFYWIDPDGREAMVRVYPNDPGEMGRDSEPYWIQYAKGDIGPLAQEIADGLNRVGGIGRRAWAKGDSANDYLNPHGIYFDKKQKKWTVGQPPTSSHASDLRQLQRRYRRD